MAKKVMLWVEKAAAAGITAFVILSIFAAVYYNPPIHVLSSNQATDYKREPDAFWARATEGFAHGTIDEAGYNNSFAGADSQVDVLMMGSSQTEGLYVDEKQCVSYLLNERYESENADMGVYNIGMSAHTFYRNVSNLQNALQVYQPNQYIAIETGFLACNPIEAEQALSDTMPELSVYQGSQFVTLMQKNPYAKLIYQQYRNYRNQSTEEAVSGGGQDAFDENTLQATRSVLSYVAQKVESYNCRAVIYLIPDMELNEAGEMVFAADKTARDTYASLCAEYGILFADMTDSVQKAYEDDDTLANGFANTTVGYGHLNPTGHRILADTIYQTIREWEE